MWSAHVLLRGGVAVEFELCRESGAVMQACLRGPGSDALHELIVAG
jgi:hypothetical protein